MHNSKTTNDYLFIWKSMKAICKTYGLNTEQLWESRFVLYYHRFFSSILMLLHRQLQASTTSCVHITFQIDGTSGEKCTKLESPGLMSTKRTVQIKWTVITSKGTCSSLDVLWVSCSLLRQQVDVKCLHHAAPLCENTDIQLGEIILVAKNSLSASWLLRLSSQVLYHNWKITSIPTHFLLYQLPLNWPSLMCQT